LKLELKKRAFEKYKKVAEKKGTGLANPLFCAMSFDEKNCSILKNLHLNSSNEFLKNVQVLAHYLNPRLPRVEKQLRIRVKGLECWRCKHEFAPSSSNSTAELAM